MVRLSCPVHIARTGYMVVTSKISLCRSSDALWSRTLDVRFTEMRRAVCVLSTSRIRMARQYSLKEYLYLVSHTYPQMDKKDQSSDISLLKVNRVDISRHYDRDRSVAWIDISDFTSSLTCLMS